ncbi:hypothetical protein [Methylocystis parvus]|uniref:hypothetical protein n=1 Tax=Methylocystis parvus TaxID=134 RepID=UPI00031145B1|nr:hypothetical protein [Methylocystis parvus]WBJ99905.1 hypothetical protein MMG94_18275 [Methylocystis parvus OBBP]
MALPPPSSVSGKSTLDSVAGEPPRYLRRKQAGSYLSEKYGFGAARTLAKAAVTGDGPEYHKAGRIVLYTREALDKWALAKIGSARRSTSAA